MRITLARKKAAMLFIKKRLRRSSNEDNMGGLNQTSRTEASMSDLPDLETYEVFLNFRGEETRKDFTDHLYTRLVDEGVWVFRDNEALHVGKEIGPELVKAVRASKISIPIISANYASSKWCLQELVHILECKKTIGQVVLPIFYQVEPSSVRNQTGTFEKAFHSHEKKYGSKRKVVQEWRDALAEVASLNGWESSKIANGHEAHLVKLVVAEVLKELRKDALVVTDCLVGIKDHKESILEMIEGKPSSNAQAIVIHGMGGIGKTTLAKVIYNQLCSSFKHRCYIPNIREKLSERKCRPEELQKQLISDIIGQQWPNEISHVDAGINIIRERFKQKKVLILFDDVDCDNQLNALARQCSWFGSGSILIITTRNKDGLKTWEGRLTYELNGLDSSHSLQLFCKHAFQEKDECRQREFHTIAKGIVATTGGLPLAIEVIGSMLLGKSKDYWEDVWKKLQKIPHKDVQKTLKISYDALDYGHQQIFLDIACLPLQDKINFAQYMWDDCEFYPKEGIEELVSRSLIKIEGENQVTIHDQLRDLGREIVRQHANNDPGDQSRIWDEEKALEVVQRKQGTAKIKALNLPYYFFDNGKNLYFTSKQFKNLTGLRFLQLHGRCHLKGDFENLLLDLRWLQWTHCSSIPTNFCPSKLVVLDLSYGKITDWEGWAQIQLVKKLRVLILCGCYLTSTPDFSAFEKLEILNLSNCIKLRTIHPSICNLNKTLLTLNVCSCQFLEELPTEMGRMEKLRQLLIDRTLIREIPILEGFMTKLEILSASYCDRLHYLPESIGKLKSLSHLILRNSMVMELPNSIGDLDKLIELDISETWIDRLPTTIGKLKNLESLFAKSLKKLIEVPDEIGELCGLRHLSFSGCSFLSQLPESIHNLCSLQELNLSDCENLKSIPNLPCNLKSLMFNGKFMETLPNMTSLSNLKHLTYQDMFQSRNRALNLGSLNNLESLRIVGVDKLDRSIEKIELILELPSSLRELVIIFCPTLRQIPDLSNCKMLSILKIYNCRSLSMLGDMGNSMAFCQVIRCDALESLSYNSSAKKLKSLLVQNSTSLMEIQGLNNVECLEKLEVGGCPLLERLDLSRLKMLKELMLRDHEKLSELDGIDKLTLLQSLKIFNCNSLEKLPDISLFTSLEQVVVERCEKLTEIKGVQEQKTLKRIRISSCNSLEKLPDISLFTSLEEVDVEGCVKLTEMKGLQEQKTLKRIRISSCNSLEKLPDISLFMSLKEVKVEGCEKLTEMKGVQEQKTLKRIRISSCNSLEKLPDISLFTSLEEVDVEGCEKLTEMKGLQEQKTLKRIRISSCNSLEKLPDISLFTSLQQVDVEGCEKLTEMKGLQEQKTLKRIRISSCNSLEKLPDILLFTSLKMVDIEGCEKLTDMKGLQEHKTLKTIIISSCKSWEKLPDISLCTSLEIVDVEGCEKLTEIKGIPMTLRFLDVSGCKSLVTLPNFSKCCYLEGLFAEGCSKLGLEGQERLKILDFSSCKSIKNFPDFLLFTELEHLCLSGCEKLNEIKGLPRSLKTLDISGCQSLENLPDFSRCRSVIALLAQGCIKLTKIIGLPEQGSLRMLDLSGCKSLEDFIDFSKLKSLEHLNLNGCDKIIEINGLPKPLKTLDICGCKWLKDLPNFSQSYSLEGLLAEDCYKLKELRGLENLDNFRVLAIHGCESLKRKPNLPNDCVRTDPLEKTMRWGLTLRTRAEKIFHPMGGHLMFEVSIIGSNFHMNGSEPQAILWMDIISFSML